MATGDIDFCKGNQCKMRCNHMVLRAYYSGWVEVVYFMEQAKAIYLSINYSIR